MALILDTNALSAFADGDEKLLRVLEQSEQLAVPVFALGEYFYGVQQSRYKAEYEEWLNRNLPLLEILAVSRETARRYAEVRAELKAVGQPIPSNDIWIAALAREHRLPLVSRDSHFQFIRGLRLLGW